MVNSHGTCRLCKDDHNIYSCYIFLNKKIRFHTVGVSTGLVYAMLLEIAQALLVVANATNLVILHSIFRRFWTTLVPTLIIPTGMFRSLAQTPVHLVPTAGFIAPLATGLFAYFYATQ